MKKRNCKNSDTITTVRILCYIKKLLMSCEYRRSFDLPKDMKNPRMPAFLSGILHSRFFSHCNYFCYEGVVS